VSRSSVPAGRVLDQAPQDAGIARAETFVINAVKHFKYELRGKRRLHKRPNNYEVERCKIWLEYERRLVKPSMIVALGVTAAPSLTGRASPSVRCAASPSMWRMARSSSLPFTPRRCCGSRKANATPLTAISSPIYRPRRPKILASLSTITLADARSTKATTTNVSIASDCYSERGAVLATPAWVSAVPICCSRLIKSTAVAGGSTRRRLGNDGQSSASCARSHRGA
jgi:hypothetical protein